MLTEARYFSACRLFLSARCGRKTSSFNINHLINIFNLIWHALCKLCQKQVLTLFNGLLDELTHTKGHIECQRLERKAESIDTCIDILNALTSMLDFDKGGEMALRLVGLYDYCVYRLYDACQNYRDSSLIFSGGF